MLRTLFLVLRSAAIFVSLVSTAWFLVVSPTDPERQRLAGAGLDRAGLRHAVQQMRLARAALTLAPGLTIDAIVRQGGGRVGRDEVEAALRAIAAGKGGPGGGQDTGAETGAAPSRPPIGARFVRPPAAG